MLTSDTAATLAKSGETYLMGHCAYPGYYLTLAGRVFSLRSRRFLSPIRMGEYVGVQIVNSDGAMVKRYLHRLVMEFWTGSVPEGMQCCHNNGNRHDNRVENLRWDTAANNHADKVLHGTSGHGERNPMAKLTPAAVTEIRRRVAAGETQRSLCAEFGVSPMTISRAARGESWSNV